MTTPPDFEAFERSGEERARRAEERELAAWARAKRSRAEARAATSEEVRREREREAEAHERAAAAQRMAIDLQREHAVHSRQLAERQPGGRSISRRSAA